MIPPPIQGLWLGDRLSKLEQLSIRSFLKHGHTYHLYTYERCAGAPEGAILRDANEILPRSLLCQDRPHGNEALLSDYFRFKLLLDRGGWWADLDVVCLRPFTFHADYVFASEMAAGGAHPASCVIKAPAGAPWLHDAWERLRSLDPGKIQWGDAGPRLVALCVEARSLQEWVQPPNVFCPIDPPDWESVLRARAPALGDDTFAIHFWHELWRRAGRDKDARYPRTCLYEQLKREHGLGEQAGWPGELMHRAKAALRPHFRAK